MPALLTIFLPLAEGRSENPDDGGGVLLIVGVIVLAALVIGTVWTLIARATSRRRGRAREPAAEGPGRHGGRPVPLPEWPRPRRS